jgi:hypothetical protein
MTYTYFQPFQFSEIELKGDKRYYVEGYISTTDPDLSNEVLTQSAQEDIVRQCNNHVITMDVEHEEFYEDDGKTIRAKPKNSRIPVAKIVEAELRSGGVWVKVEINRNSDRFERIWKSIQEGFLHSFSVAFYPLRAITKKVGNQVLKFIDNLSLINVTLTGSPVNPNATFSPVMKAIVRDMASTPVIEGEKTMEQPELKVEPVASPVVAEVQAEVVTPVAPEVKADPMDSVIKSLEALRKDMDAMKKAMDSQKPSDENKVEEAKEDEAEKKGLDVLGGLNTSVKAMQDEIADLKAKLAEPVFKASGPSVDPASFAKQTQVKSIKSVLDELR